jgi:hypothetical protein
MHSAEAFTWIINRRRPAGQDFGVTPSLVKTREGEWSRWESNPRPNTRPVRPLHA